MNIQDELALKYRPSQLDDVVGQPHVVETLKQAARLNRFAHAYLFAGRYGSGKTSVARILAALMNCQNLKDGVACGTCEVCEKIRNDTCLDVIELDGGQKGGVDNIKEVLESAKWPPQELQKKVYIIDECQVLTSQANAALLKDLEEPCGHVAFVLCTMSPDKVPDPIFSRCQKFRFRQIPSRDAAQHIQDVAARENINIENGVADIIARASRGSLRDGLNLLDKLHTVKYGEPITKDFVLSFEGLPDRAVIANMIEAMKQSQVPLVLDMVNDLVMASVEAEDLLYEMSQAFRDMTVLKAQKGDTKSTVDLTDAEAARLTELADDISVRQLLELAHLFSDIGRKVRFNINKRWIMEATIIDCIVALRK